MIASTERRMDDVLRARLNLSGRAPLSLGALRLLLNTVDAASRLFTARPFFALRESEALLARLDGVPTDRVADIVLGLGGGTRITPHGLGNVPDRGAVIIASTHPTGMFDFIAHAGALARRRPDLKVVANQEVEMFLGPDAIVPVRFDRNNRALSSEATYAGMQAHLQDGGALLIFGSGRVPHCRNGQLVEPKWRSGASRASLACGVPVIPAAIDARNSCIYYWLRSAAQSLSAGNDNFGAMVGSLRYAAELIDKLGGRFDVHYGQPIQPGCSPASLKAEAESLVPGLYA